MNSRHVFVCKIILENLVVRYRGKIIKVFWRDPGQNGGFWGPFLVHWNSNLPSNVEKLTFWRPVRPAPAKVREKSCVCSVRSPRTPLDLPNFNLNYQKNCFCEKLNFSRFTNRSLDNTSIYLTLYVALHYYCAACPSTQHKFIIKDSTVGGNR